MKKQSKNNKLVLVDFWANWCGPCRALAPTIVELAKEYSGKVLIGKLDVDENPATAEKFQVFSIPTMIVFKDGTRSRKTRGVMPKEQNNRRTTETFSITLGALFIFSYIFSKVQRMLDFKLF